MNHPPLQDLTETYPSLDPRKPCFARGPGDGHPQVVQSRGPSSQISLQLVQISTSDFKRGPARRVITMLVAESRAAGIIDRPVRVLNIMGHRSQESAERANRSRGRLDLSMVQLSRLWIG